MLNETEPEPKKLVINGVAEILRGRREERELLGDKPVVVFKPREMPAHGLPRRLFDFVADGRATRDGRQDRVVGAAFRAEFVAQQHPSFQEKGRIRIEGEPNCAVSVRRLRVDEKRDVFGDAARDGPKRKNILGANRGPAGREDSPQLLRREGLQTNERRPASVEWFLAVLEDPRHDRVHAAADDERQTRGVMVPVPESLQDAERLWRHPEEVLKLVEKYRHTAVLREQEQFLEESFQRMDVG